MKPRAPARRWKHAAVAAAAAYALLLQALLLSLGGALHVAAAHEPQAVICAPGADAGSDPLPFSAHEGLCCLLGCQGPAPAPPRPGTDVLERAAPVAAAPFRPRHGPSPPVTSDVLPLGPRAPPRLG